MSVGDVIALAALVVAVFAAIAASRSARAAELAAQNATLAKRRAMVREIVISAESIVDEGDTIEALVEQLRAQHTTLRALTGNMWDGSSGLVLFTNKLDARVEEVAPLTKRACGIGDAHSLLSTAARDDLSRAQVPFPR